MVVTERYNFRYYKALITLIVEERDFCSAFLQVEEVYLEFLKLLYNEKEEMTADRRADLSEGGGH